MFDIKIVHRKGYEKSIFKNVKYRFNGDLLVIQMDDLSNYHIAKDAIIKLSIKPTKANKGA